MNTYRWLLVCGAVWAPLALCHADTSTCTSIGSSLERLACFDLAAGTPVDTPIQPPALAEAPRPEIVKLMHANEATRTPENSRFILSSAAERGQASQQRVVISAPALGALAPRPVLTLSCLSNISRLQFVLAAPIEHNQVQVRLVLDERTIGPTQSWQVLESGVLVDAGRGLAAIEQIKRLSPGNRLRVESDHPQLDGLLFDTEGLHELIRVERQACHW